MKPSEYIDILQSKVVIDKEIATLLESIIEEYSFFHSARAVYLKYLHDQGSFRYNSNLKLTAAHTLDRTVLFNYITSSGFKALENIEPVWSHVYVEPTKLEDKIEETPLPEIISDVISEEIIVEEPIEESVEVVEDEINETSLQTPDSVKEILIEGIDILESEPELIEESAEILTQDLVDEKDFDAEFYQELAQTNELEWVADVQDWKDKTEHIEVEKVESLTPEEELELQEEQDFEHRDWFEHKNLQDPIFSQETESFVNHDVLEQDSEVLEDIASDELNQEIYSEEPTVVESEEIIEVEKPIQFNRNEKHSFQEWLQLTAIKPIEREPITVEPVVQPSTDVKKKKMDLIDRFINLNPRMPKATAYDSNSQESIISRAESDTALMTETLAQVYLQQKKYDRAIQAYEILILKYPEKSSFFADRIKDVKILKKDNTNK